MKQQLVQARGLSRFYLFLYTEANSTSVSDSLLFANGEYPEKIFSLVEFLILT